MSAYSAPSSCRKLLGEVAERVAPLFFGVGGSSRDTARLAAIKAIEAYEPRTPTDYATVARILALSLAAMSAVNRAMEPDLPVDLQLGYYSKASALSQAALRFEAVLARSREGAADRDQAQPSGLVEVSRADEAAILAAADRAMAEFEKLQFPSSDAPPGLGAFPNALTPIAAPHGQRLC